MSEAPYAPEAVPTSRPFSFSSRTYRAPVVLFLKLTVTLSPSMVIARSLMSPSELRGVPNKAPAIFCEGSGHLAARAPSRP